MRFISLMTTLANRAMARDLRLAGLACLLELGGLACDATGAAPQPPAKSGGAAPQEVQAPKQAAAGEPGSEADARGGDAEPNASANAENDAKDANASPKAPTPHEPWPTRAEAGGAACTASEAIVLGENTQRRSSNVGPLENLYTYNYSNVILVEVGGGLLAAWPKDEGSVEVQPLDREGRPRGPATTVPLPGAAALYAFVAHGGGSPHALLLSHRRCKGNHKRCLASQWVDAEGRPVGAAFDMQLERDYLDDQLLAPEPRGVLTASAYDNTVRGYTTAACRNDDGSTAEGEGCPLVMPSPKLHLYTLDPAAPSAEPTLLFDVVDQAVEDTLLPIVAGDLRGALHFFVDRKHTQRATLRIVGRPPRPLAKIERGYWPLRVHVDPEAGILSVLRVDLRALFWRYSLDGALLEGPTKVNLATGTPPPFAEHVVGEIAAGPKGTVVFRRALTREQTVGEALVLTHGKIGAGASPMHSVVWTGERYVALYGEAAGRGTWTIKVQAITCPGG